eukprot:1144021-Pelagomonas_calceolata.AAC.4
MQRMLNPLVHLHNVCKCRGCCTYLQERPVLLSCMMGVLVCKGGRRPLVTASVPYSSTISKETALYRAAT